MGSKQYALHRPEFFDAVVADDDGTVREIQVKRPDARSNWIWGAFKMPGRVLHELHALWKKRNPPDEYLGTLVNEYLARGGQATAVRAGEAYVDVGTLHGYREAIKLLGTRPQEPAPPVIVHGHRPAPSRPLYPGRDAVLADGRWIGQIPSPQTPTAAAAQP